MILTKKFRASPMASVSRLSQRSRIISKSLTIFIVLVTANEAWPQAQSGAVSENVGSAVYRKVSPSVLIVRAKSGSAAVQGSGVAYRHGMDGKTRSPNQTWVATNAHVISGTSSIRVQSGSQSYQANLEYADDDLDIAILNIPDAVIPVVKVANANAVGIGDRVFAIGSPLGLENSITDGIVSGRREYKGAKVVQTSAAISQGNSGGGLFDPQGQLVGITTFKLVGGENLNFAVDAAYIDVIMDAHLAASMIRSWYSVGGLEAQAEKLVTSSAFTKWLLRKKSTEGESMYQVVLRVLDEAFKSRDRKAYVSFQDSKFSEIVTQFLSDSQVGTAPTTSNSADGAAFRVVCPMYAARDRSYQNELSLKLDPPQSLVNGQPATFSESQIVFQTGKDNKYRGVLNRYSATVTVGNDAYPALLTGKCARVTERQF